MIEVLPGQPRNHIAGFLFLLVLAAIAPRTSARLQGGRDTRFFALHMSRDARALADTVEEHLAGHRWNEAIGALQTLIAKHGGDVLPEDRRASAGQFSEYAAHPGAAQWAYDRLHELPREALEVYEARYEAQAGRVLTEARAGANRRALVKITDRWPVAPAAARAWWTLGDLELEEGHLEAARASWTRGLVLDGLLGRTRSDGMQARQTLLEDLSSRKESGGTLPQRTREEIPRKDAEPWICDLFLEPFDKRSGGARYHHNLLPVLGNEKLFVCSTLRLFAIDAFTGDLIWQAGPPEGWDKLDSKRREPLFSGIADDQLLVRPAVGGGISVAALQIPYSETDNYDWQGIPILTAIPERRLYAFDSETGEELWNHAPALTWQANRWIWDRNYATYPERMLISGPPTISGSRVLVPCYRMQGRIDYHVACYELRSGELLWSTPIVSGQRPRNMFGRANREFASAPLVVDKDRVIAQTDLGTVAVLDLMTGRVIWQSLYRQIELPKTQSYKPPERTLTWRVAPPVVVGNLIISTPSDSHEIAAFNLTDGRVSWAYDSSTLERADIESNEFAHDLLLGADHDTVYLGGQKVSALEKPGGLSSRTRFLAKWTYKISDKENTSLAARPTLTSEALVIPHRKERIVLNRADGRRLGTHSGAWPTSDYGNTLARDGVLYVINNDRVLGFFDWDALLERQRIKLSKNPADATITLATAELFARRGRSYLADEDLAGALDSLREARELLEPLRKGQDGPLTRRVHQGLHDVLRFEAEVLTRRGNRGQALRMLDLSIPLAASLEALRDVLLQKDRLLQLSQRYGERLELLAQIDESCGDLSLPHEAQSRNPPLWLIGDASIKPSVLADWQEAGIRMRLWVLLNRAQIYLEMRNTFACLEDLHIALELYGDLPLADGVDLGRLVRERISMRRLAPDGTRAYAPFETRARDLLMRAMNEDDPYLLAEVGRLYPHSRASQEALRARLDWAYERSDAEAVASIVASSLANPGGDRSVQAGMLLRLGRSIGELGNHEFENALIGRLAEEFHNLASDLPDHQGATLGELERRLPSPTPEKPLALPRFGTALVSSGRPSEGSFEFIGHLTPEGQTEEVHIYWANKQLDAFSMGAPNNRAWSYSLPEPISNSAAFAVTGQTIFLGDLTMVRALDSSGKVLWERKVSESVQTITAHSGIVIANLTGSNVAAFDAVGGTPLWELSLGDGNWNGPIAGEGRLAFFRPQHAKHEQAVIVDPFRGQVLLELDLGNVNGKLHETCWIADGQLIVPDFGRYSPAEVCAYDFESGSKTWTISFHEGESFHSIATHKGDDYLITTVAELGDMNRAAVYRLNTELGTTRPVERMRVGEEPMGIDREQRTKLSTPYLFVHATDKTREGIPVRAIHLPFNAVWKYTLPLSPKETYTKNMPMPVVSENYVAIAYSVKNRTGLGRKQTALVFLDKRAGKKLDTLDLNDQFNYAKRLELRGLGRALFVIGKGSRTLGLRLETLEESR